MVVTRIQVQECRIQPFLLTRSSFGPVCLSRARRSTFDIRWNSSLAVDVPPTISLPSKHWNLLYILRLVFFIQRPAPFLRVTVDGNTDEIWSIRGLHCLVVFGNDPIMSRLGWAFLATSRPTNDPSFRSTLQGTLHNPPFLEDPRVPNTDCVGWIERSVTRCRGEVPQTTTSCLEPPSRVPVELTCGQRGGS